MRYQQKPGTCGAAAVVNTLRAFGIKVTERRAAVLANTDYEGTDEIGIISSLRVLGFTVEEYKGNQSGPSWTWLNGSLLQGRPVILAVDNSGHWITTVGTLRDRVVIIDSTTTRANKSENGIHVLSRNWLLRRWVSWMDDCKYYGISVGKGKSPI